MEHEHISWTCPYFDDEPEHYGYEKVFIDYSGGYDWNAIVVVRNLDDGRLYGWVGGGCSCSSLGDFVPNDLSLIKDGMDFARQVTSYYAYESGSPVVELMRALYNG